MVVTPYVKRILKFISLVMSNVKFGYLLTIFVMSSIAIIYQIQIARLQEKIEFLGKTVTVV